MRKGRLRGFADSRRDCGDVLAMHITRGLIYAMPPFRSSANHPTTEPLQQETDYAGSCSWRRRPRMHLCLSRLGCQRGWWVGGSIASEQRGGGERKRGLPF